MKKVLAVLAGIVFVVVAVCIALAVIWLGSRPAGWLW